MTPAVLARILESIFSSPLLGESVSLLWHAGEPLVIPPGFYQEAMALIERLNTRGVRVSSALYTNGTRITPQWCDFINRYDIQVGVSLDGPEHIHDRSRVDWGGRGTFERTMRGISLLQEHGIQPSILMVLTSYALEYPDEIWQFFYDHHLTRICFNVEEVNGAHTRSSLDGLGDVEEKYKRFLRRMLELNARCEQPLSIREIETFEERIRVGKWLLSQENIPGTLVSFDYAGNVSTFASEVLTMKHPRYGDFLLGNIFDSTLEDLLTSPKLLAINGEVQCGVKLCQESCDYFDYCGGGSPPNKLSEHGRLDATETLCCRLKIKATMDVMVEYMESLYPAS
jgi:uncharacterized protein